MPDAETTHAMTDEAGHGHGHDAGHDAAHTPAGPLGAVDVATWGYAVAGSLLGLLTVLALYVAGGA